MDPDDHHLFVSLGCAAENLALASGARGRPGELHLDPSNDAAVVFEFSSGQASVSALFDAIPVRQSSRADYDGRPVSGADLPELTVAVRHADDRRANFAIYLPEWLATRTKAIFGGVYAGGGHSHPRGWVSAAP